MSDERTPRVKLYRIPGSNPVIGAIYIDDNPERVAYTLENGWFDNTRGYSCIPAGRYDVRLCSHSEEYGFAPSPSHGDVYCVQRVPHRTRILIHPGNTDEDTEGCILVGATLEYWERTSAWAITSSVTTMAKLMRILKGKPFTLDIRGWGYLK